MRRPVQGSRYFEVDTQVFIIRIWLEHRQVKGRKAVLRGMIEHVPSGEQHYLKRLTEIPKLIASVFKKEGLNYYQQSRLAPWFDKMKWLIFLRR